MSARVTIDETNAQPETYTIKSIFTADELESLPNNLKKAIERSEHNHLAKLHLTKLMKNGKSTILNNRQKFSR
jgi:hypothetical protein